MKQLQSIFILSICLVLSGVSGAAETGMINIETCTDDLENLQLLTSDASEQAIKTNRTFSEKEECKNHIDEHEHGQEACDNLETDYQSDVFELRDDLRELENRLRAIQRSCGFDFILSNRGRLLK